MKLALGLLLLSGLLLFGCFQQQTPSGSVQTNYSTSQAQPENDFLNLTVDGVAYSFDQPTFIMNRSRGSQQDVFRFELTNGVSLENYEGRNFTDPSLNIQYYSKLEEPTARTYSTQEPGDVQYTNYGVNPPLVETQPKLKAHSEIFNATAQYGVYDSVYADVRRGTFRITLNILPEVGQRVRGSFSGTFIGAWNNTVQINGEFAVTRRAGALYGVSDLRIVAGSNIQIADCVGPDGGYVACQG